MTAPIPFTEHEENDFFEDVERELVALTTAKLEEVEMPSKTVVGPASQKLTLPTAPKTVIPAKAGTHTMRAASDDNEIVATHKGYGSPPAPGVIPASGRNNKHHRNN